MPQDTLSPDPDTAVVVVRTARDALIPDLAVAPGPPMATVRVLHVINGEHYAGAERVQDLLAKRLPEWGFQVGFACVKLDLFDECRQAREAPLLSVPMRSRLDLRAAWKVAGIVRRHQYRILHAHTARTALVGSIAARLAGVPLVYHAHSPASYDTTQPWRNWLNGVVERLSLRRTARVIAVSEALANHVAGGGLDPARITVVYNGVPYPQSLPPRQTPAGTWMLGTTALFRPRKGIEVLLEAMAILREQGVPVSLRAVGSFESRGYEAEIASRVRQLGLKQQVFWTGFVRDAAAELLQMDLFVLPSLFGEGLPMVVLEAMAAGVPIVATRVAGVPEAVRDGQEGLLVAPGNAKALAQAIDRVIRGTVNWSDLRTNELARHARLFSDRAMAAGVAAVYRDLLARK